MNKETFQQGSFGLKTKTGAMKIEISEDGLGPKYTYWHKKISSVPSGN